MNIIISFGILYGFCYAIALIIRIHKLQKSDFERGFEWAMHELANGVSEDNLYRIIDTSFDYNDFDRGALEYLRSDKSIVSIQ